MLLIIKDTLTIFIVKERDTMHWFAFIAGLLLGGFLGIIIATALAVSGREEEQMGSAYENLLRDSEVDPIR
ncbi:MAG: hypothetical protein HY808_00780 [Nitrospirae bacterium]|nr:hypothetical protein [Nitrospirota bacterium]